MIELYIIHHHPMSCCVSEFIRLQGLRARAAARRKRKQAAKAETKEASAFHDAMIVETCEKTVRCWFIHIPWTRFILMHFQWCWVGDGQSEWKRDFHVFQPVKWSKQNHQTHQNIYQNTLQVHNPKNNESRGRVADPIFNFPSTGAPSSRPMFLWVFGGSRVVGLVWERNMFLIFPYQYYLYIYICF